MLLVSLIVLFVSLIGAPLLTQLMTYDPAMWWIPPVLRVVWLALAAWFAARTLRRERDVAAWMIAGPALLAAGLCFNPVADLLRGPARLHGHLDFMTYETDDTIEYHVVLATDDGGLALEVSYFQMSAVRAQLTACDGKDAVDLVALRHLDVVLSVGCP